MREEHDPASIADLVDSTPTTRDRYVDLLRALSIAVVVLGHWLIAIVYVEDGHIGGESALDVIPGVWILTWVLQVMPVFFFVGGFSNAVAYDSAIKRGVGYAGFMRSRVERLMRPTIVFVVAWTALALVVQLTFEVGEGFVRATSLIAKPLWFLAVYMIAIAVAPPMLALHRKAKWWVPLGLIVAAAIVDLLRIGADIPGIGYLNFAFVWLFPHQIGYFYADGTLTAWKRRTHAFIALGGLAALTVLVNIGVYSPSMVGMRSDKVSNNDPPSICLIALVVWLVGLAMTFREPAQAWLQDRRVWAAVIGANSVIMTVFLWHLTALLCTVLVAYPLGWPQLDAGSAAWWATRPPWILLLTLFLTPFVLAFGRFERGSLGRRAEPAARFPLWMAATAVALLVGGLAGFALWGFVGIAELGSGPLLGAPPPLLSAISLTAGIGLAGIEWGR